MYRQVDTRIWGDKDFRELSDDGKLAWLFILTHPAMTSVGAMRATTEGLAAELGWPAERLRKALAIAFRKGWLAIDDKACFVAVENFLKYNPPQSPNVVRSWAAIVATLPECNHKYLLIKRVKAFLEGFSEAFQEAFRVSLPNQEQEQEQEQEQDNTPLTPQGGKAHASKENQEAETLYQLYPIHKGKGAAIKAIIKALKKTDFETLCPVVEAFTNNPDTQAKLANPEERKFIPHPATWFNQERWKDEEAAGEQSTFDDELAKVQAEEAGHVSGK